MPRPTEHLAPHEAKRRVQEGFRRLRMARSCAALRGPKGGMPCVWCGAELTGRKQHWCSQECVDQYRSMSDWTLIRRHVERRDHGVCALCGCDTFKVQRVVRWAIRISYGSARVYRLHHDGVDEVLRDLGFDTHGDSLWHADHIVPRVEGGTHELENIRTLCHPCHKAETAALAARRAQARRDAKAEEAGLFAGGEP